MAYSVKKSAEKGGSGAIDGLIASVISAIIIGLIKANVQDIDQNTENTIAAGTAAMVSAAAVAIKRFVGNWIKHRESNKPKAPKQAPAPAQPAAPNA